MYTQPGFSVYRTLSCFPTFLPTLLRLKHPPSEVKPSTFGLWSDVWVPMLFPTCGKFTICRLLLDTTTPLPEPFLFP